MGKIYERDCDYCESGYKGRGKKYCSPSCAAAAQANDETRRCQSCDDEFSPNSSDQKFCDWDCYLDSVQSLDDDHPQNNVETPEELPTEDELQASNKLEQRRNKDGTKTLTAENSTRIKTLQQLIDACDIDLDKWEIDRHVINQWDMGYKDKNGRPGVKELYQVKAWLSPRQDIIDADAILNDLKEDAAQHSPVVKPIDYSIHSPENPADKYMLEINISDAHLAMLAWGEETGGPDWDLKSGQNMFMWAVQNIIQKASGVPLDQIVFIVGNDLAHSDIPVNGKGGATTAGTVQDVDTRRKKMTREIRSMIVRAIEELLMPKAPVKVIIVPGNHDEETMFHIGDSLECWFRNNANVTIDNRPKLRKYHKYGEVLLGFTHSSHESIKRLPLLMPIEKKEAWGDTTYREFHCGHEHHKTQRDVISVREEQGIRIRFFPSIAPPDQWHAKKGYVGSVRAAEGHLWNRKTGWSGMWNANVPLGEED